VPPFHLHRESVAATAGIGFRHGTEIEIIAAAWRRSRFEESKTPKTNEQGSASRKPAESDERFSPRDRREQRPLSAGL